MKKIFVAMMTILSLAAVVQAAEKAGTVQVTVVDENGALVQNAPIYIYGTQKTQFVGGKEIAGTTLLRMPAGTYRVSSAIVKRTGDYMDRYASHEAYVRIEEGDHTAILLTLRPIDDPTSSLTYADLRKIGIAPTLAQNLR